jgi:hypothetical protein
MQPTELTPEEAAPAPTAAVAKARAAIEKYNVMCFWFRSDEAPLESVADVRLVARRLREYGDRETWFVAREIERCL